MATAMTRLIWTRIIIFIMLVIDLLLMAIPVYPVRSFSEIWCSGETNAGCYGFFKYPIILAGLSLGILVISSPMMLCCTPAARAVDVAAHAILCICWMVSAGALTVGMNKVYDRDRDTRLASDKYFQLSQFSPPWTWPACGVISGVVLPGCHLLLAFFTYAQMRNPEEASMLRRQGVPTYQPMAGPMAPGTPMQAGASMSPGSTMPSPIGAPMQPGPGPGPSSIHFPRGAGAMQAGPPMTIPGQPPIPAHGHVATYGGPVQSVSEKSFSSTPLPSSVK